MQAKYGRQRIEDRPKLLILIMLVPLTYISYQLFLSWGQNSERNNENATTYSKSGWFGFVTNEMEIPY